MRSMPYLKLSRTFESEPRYTVKTGLLVWAAFSEIQYLKCRESINFLTAKVNSSIVVPIRVVNDSVCFVVCAFDNQVITRTIIRRYILGAWQPSWSVTEILLVLLVSSKIFAGSRCSIKNKLRSFSDLMNFSLIFLVCFWVAFFIV